MYSKIGRVTVLLTLTVAMAFFLAGCGGPTGPKMNTVKGKVTLAGTPLPGGTLNFVSSADPKEVGNTLINLDGTYSVELAKTGDYKVGVQGPGPASNPNEKRAPVALPAKYREPSSSGLSVSVKEGTQEHDFDLKK